MPCWTHNPSRWVLYVQLENIFFTVIIESIIIFVHGTLVVRRNSVSYSLCRVGIVLVGQTKSGVSSSRCVFVRSLLECNFIGSHFCCSFQAISWIYVARVMEHLQSKCNLIQKTRVRLPFFFFHIQYTIIFCLFSLHISSFCIIVVTIERKWKKKSQAEIHRCRRRQHTSVNETSESCM